MAARPSRSPKAKKVEYDLAPPSAASLIESLRAFGYDLATALADLVDNSISAGARNVWIHTEWEGEQSAITVLDDGRGMSLPELLEAMRPGGRGPLVARDPKDLGRFGLGLKTASFSQCRRVTVRTRKHGEDAVTRVWDLDYIAQCDEWRLLREADPAAEELLGDFKKLKQGTVVVWQLMDKFVQGLDANVEDHHRFFLHRIEAVKSHLGMVFHRLMTKTRGTAIYVNGRKLEAWDPFLSRYESGQPLPPERLKCFDCYVDVQPYVLPHLSKVNKAAHERAAGPKGWNAHQGFYIYRNERLLVAGDWLGLGWAQEEHYKLARIQVDIPNSLDLEWEIDVTKSKARPPSVLRNALKRIAERTRSNAKRVYTHRGAKLVPQGENVRVFLWEPNAKNNRTFYRINRDHPIVREVVAKCEDKATLNALLRLLEETIPLQHITIENTERPDRQPQPFEDATESQIGECMRQAYRSLRSSGLPPSQARERLRTLWPFENFPALLEALEENPKAYE